MRYWFVRLHAHTITSSIAKMLMLKFNKVLDAVIVIGGYSIWVISD